MQASRRESARSRFRRADGSASGSRVCGGSGTGAPGVSVRSATSACRRYRRVAAIASMKGRGVFLLHFEVDALRTRRPPHTWGAQTLNCIGSGLVAGWERHSTSTGTSSVALPKGCLTSSTSMPGRSYGSACLRPEPLSCGRRGPCLRGPGRLRCLCGARPRPSPYGPSQRAPLSHASLTHGVELAPLPPRGLSREIYSITTWVLHAAGADTRVPCGLRTRRCTLPSPP